MKLSIVHVPDDKNDQVDDKAVCEEVLLEGEAEEGKGQDGQGEVEECIEHSRLA